MWWCKPTSDYVLLNAGLTSKARHRHTCMENSSLQWTLGNDRKQWELTVPLSAFLHCHCLSIYVIISKQSSSSKEHNNQGKEAHQLLTAALAVSGSHFLAANGTHAHRQDHDLYLPSPHPLSSSSSCSAHKQTPQGSSTFIFCPSLFLPHLRSWALLSILDAHFALSFSSSVSILLLFFGLIMSFLLWISTIVRQRLAERKIRNSNSKERKVEERGRHLKTWSFIQQHPVICCWSVCHSGVLFINMCVLFCFLVIVGGPLDCLMPSSTSYHHPSLTLTHLRKMMMVKRQPCRKRQQECSHVKVDLKCPVLQLKQVRPFGAEQPASERPVPLQLPALMIPCWPLCCKNCPWVFKCWHFLTSCRQFPPLHQFLRKKKWNLLSIILRTITLIRNTTSTDSGIWLYEAKDC